MRAFKQESARAAPPESESGREMPFISINSHSNLAKAPAAVR
jgi:hypothetical protein